MIQRQTLVQDEKQQEQYEASVEVEDAEETADAAQENSLMLVRGMVDDDMEHIADMKEQFSQTIDPILRMYNAAMCATTARLEIIEDEFKYRKLRCPIHHIDTRLKSAKSILGKLQKKNLDLTLSAACNNIYDIAGVRVICPFITDVYHVAAMLMNQTDVEVIRVKDYIEHPKDNGYRSLHVIVMVDVFFSDEKKKVPIEIQFRTIAMNFWASTEHQLRYKKEEKFTPEMHKQLKRCADLMARADRKMQRLAEQCQTEEGR